MNRTAEQFDPNPSAGQIGHGQQQQSHQSTALSQQQQPLQSIPIQQQPPQQQLPQQTQQQMASTLDQQALAKIMGIIFNLLLGI